jgi:hypothetical protein
MHGTTGTPVPLATLGGLVTLASPDSLPEGASPRCYDNDYLVGQTETRDGLTSQYQPLGIVPIGPNAPTVAATDSVLPWTNPSNILHDDGSFASVAAYPASGNLYVTGFVENLPSTDNPQVYEVALKGWSDSNAQVSVSLILDGVSIGNPRTITLPSSNSTITLGSLLDGWGVSLSYSQINDPSFGLAISVNSSFPLAQAFLDYVTITVGVNEAAENFDFITTFTAQNGSVKNLSLDAAGNFYIEDVTNNPGVLTLAMDGISPNSFAVGVNGPDVEYLAFNDLTSGSDMPRQYTANWIDRITQVGPGAAPAFSPGAATANTFAISTITQNPAHYNHNNPGNFDSLLWSAGPGNTQPGNTVTVYYDLQYGEPGWEDFTLVDAFNSGQSVYVYISGASVGTFANGTYLVTSVGQGLPPGLDHWRYFFTFQIPTTNYQNLVITPGQYQITVATMTTSVPVPNLEIGNNITISGSSVASYDSSWPISETLNSGAMAITESSVASGVATLNYSVSQGTPPVKGQLVTITGTTNANGALNQTNVPITSSTAYGGIVSTSGTAVTWVSGDNFSNLSAGQQIVIAGASYIVAASPAPTSTTLSVTSTAGTQTAVPYNSGTLINGTFTYAVSTPDAASAPEEGQATTAGTIFAFDPGVNTLGGLTDPIYGNANGGTLVFTSAVAQLIGTGTRQGVVFFITRNGYWTSPSPPVTFTCPENTTAINVSLPIGPPNVVARGIAITEPGQNGVPGDNFFTIPTPVTYIVANVSYTATALIINDNTSTSASFSFPDTVLLNALAVDVQGFNLFNQIEIGEPGWIVPYAARNFYGLCRNKIQNFNNLSFDGGYLPAGTLNPLGWTTPDAYGSLSVSPVFGNSYYIKNTTSGTLAVAGLISQTAYQDAYQQPIININTAYSVRMTARTPSSNTTGNLVITLTANGAVMGSYSLPFADMTSSMATYTGTLLVNEFPTVPSALMLNVSAQGIGAGADVEIDRFDVFPTAIPILTTTVYGSYANDVEQVDGVTGQGLFQSENQQPVNGAVVMYDTFYGLKESSMYSWRSSPNLEPSQWEEPEVAQRAGACGINAYDFGEQWLVEACENGCYLYEGGQPGKINQEIYQVWKAINWQQKKCIWVRNDVVGRRLFIGVPMATPNFWLPNAPVNANPTSPNVILMCNYQGIDSGEGIKTSPQMHTTMFGDLKAIDMRRKWSIWQIPSPYAAFVQTNEDQKFYICNGAGNSKIYALDPNASDDDGTQIDSLYITYGFPDATTRQKFPALGPGNIRVGYFDFTGDVTEHMDVRFLPNQLIGPGDSTVGYNPWTIPGGFDPIAGSNWNRKSSVNFFANRAFVEFRGAGFRVSALILTISKDVWNSPWGPK